MNYLDCEYGGFCAQRKKFIVREQLYPESRGYIVHAFDTEESARKATKPPEAVKAKVPEMA